MNKKPFLNILKHEKNKLGSGFVVKFQRPRVFSFNDVVFNNVEAVEIEPIFLDEFPKYIAHYKGVVIRNGEEVGFVIIEPDEIESANEKDAENHLAKMREKNKKPLWNIIEMIGE